MEEKPYHIMMTSPEPAPPSSGQPNPDLAGKCFLFGALFALMFVGSAWTFDWTPMRAVMVGWAASTSVGCFSMGWGMLTGRRSPAVFGACLVLAALATMFTLVFLLAGP